MMKVNVSMYGVILTAGVKEKLRCQTVNQKGNYCSEVCSSFKRLSFGKES